MTKKMISLRLDEQVLKKLDEIALESHRSRTNTLEVLILKEANEKALKMFNGEIFAEEKAKPKMKTNSIKKGKADG
jgi:predicted transcriptional regulator